MYLAVLCILWLATWVAVYRGQPLQNVQASWTAALLVSGGGNDADRFLTGSQV